MILRNLVAAATLAIAGAALAQTATTTASIPLTSTNWSKSLAVSQFNMPGYHLTSVDLAFHGNVQSSYYIENLSVSSATYSVGASYNLAVSSYSGASLLNLQPTVAPVVAQPLQAFDKVDDYGGVSGASGALAADASNAVTLASAADLVAFTGTGTVALPVAANASASISASANADEIILTKAAADVLVTYHYAPDAPLLGNIGDFVWFDANGNGKQDDGEKGVPGLTIQLLDGSGNALKTTTTAADGTYLFTDLPAGGYQVKFSKPTGYGYTIKDASVADDAHDSDADGGGLSPVINLGAGEDNLTVDAGLVGTLCLGDKVFKDCDGDGIQDSGEPGVPGVAVHLLDANGNVLADTTTNANGNYLFSNLAPGDYTVDFDAPAGYGFTKQNAGTNRATDSNADLGTGQADATLTANDFTIDAGLVYSGKIGDTVWLDCDGDGVYEPQFGEKGIPNVHVYLYGDLNGDGWPDVYYATTTDKDGHYLFNGLQPGNYMVVVSPWDVNGLAPTYDLDGTNSRNTAIGRLVAGTDRLDFDFGYRKSSTCSPKPCDWWKCNPGSWSHCSTNVGGKCHTKSIQLCWLKKDCGSDCSIKLYQCLISCKLNIANGCAPSSSVCDAISKCDTWLKSYPVGCKVPSNASCWTSIKSSCDTLDNFNCGH